MELTKEHFEKHLKGQLDPLKIDVADLKTDVTGLKTDVADLKSDSTGLKSDIDSIKVQVNSIAIDLTAVRETVDRIDKRDLDDSDALSSTYVDHDNRLKVIEKKLNIKVVKTA